MMVGITHDGGKYHSINCTPCFDSHFISTYQVHGGRLVSQSSIAMAAKVMLAICLLFLCAGQTDCVKRKLPLISSRSKQRAKTTASSNLPGSASSSADVPAAAEEPTLADWVGRKFLENKMSAKDFSETFPLCLNIYLMH